MKNYYDILEVNRKASKEVIEKAYKVLIKKYHPDLAKGEKKQEAEVKTKEINEAYNILSNDFLREQYDLELEKKREQNYYQENKTKDYANKNNDQYKKKNDNSINNEQNIENDSDNNNSENLRKKTREKNKIGTFGSIVELLQNLVQLIRKSTHAEEVESDAKKNIIAFLLTIVVVVIIGIILWFIPFTNGWMRGLLFENPLFNWIGMLFS